MLRIKYKQVIFAQENSIQALPTTIDADKNEQKYYRKSNERGVVALSS